MTVKPRACVIGAGAWGTALANQLALTAKVCLVARNEQRVGEILSRGESPRLPQVPIREDIMVDSLPDEHASIWCYARPYAFLDEFLAQYENIIRERAISFVIASKGISAAGELATDLWEKYGVSQNGLMLSGPSFAKDLASGKPVAVALAGHSDQRASSVAEYFHNGCMRIYPGDDPRGVAFAGAVKNVMALACGIVSGAQLGQSAMAAVAARGFAEMLKLCDALHIEPKTLMGLAGFGDLFLTASSMQSRNMQFGRLLGEGFPPDEAAQQVFGFIEGRMSVPGVVRLGNRAGVQMPIVHGIDALLAEQVTITQLVDGLLARPMSKQF